jgi:hypothetical protein
MGSMSLVDSMVCTVVTGIEGHCRFVVLACGDETSGRAVCAADTATVARAVVPSQVSGPVGRPVARIEPSSQMSAAQATIRVS